MGQYFTSNSQIKEELLLEAEDLKNELEQLTRQRLSTLKETLLKSILGDHASLVDMAFRMLARILNARSRAR